MAINSFEDAADILPKFLSPADRKQLFREVQAFLSSGKLTYYTIVEDPEPLQGDGWSPAIFFDVNSGTCKSGIVCIVSNSCDIAQRENVTEPLAVTMAPIVTISKFRNVLSNHGVSESSIDDQIRQIQRQEVSSIFYLPRGAKLTEDSLALFDLVGPAKRKMFNPENGVVRLFTLSQSAWWLFLVKLGIHYCRAQEGFRRA